MLPKTCLKLVSGGFAVDFTLETDSRSGKDSEAKAISSAGKGTQQARPPPSAREVGGRQRRPLDRHSRSPVLVPMYSLLPGIQTWFCTPQGGSPSTEVSPFGDGKTFERGQ